MLAEQGLDEAVKVVLKFTLPKLAVGVPFVDQSYLQKLFGCFVCVND